jgi:probable phosphoglycerate mutase
MSWPSRLYLVRHGESLGNVARDLAHRAGADLIDITDRDMDVDLSQTGKKQAAALGRWFRSLPTGERPKLILTSPYMRAHATARLIQEEATDQPSALPVIVDERLREKELGLLNRYTRRGVEAKFPEQARLRTQIGKFYYRPPQGESWADVILRLRSFLDTLCLQHGGKPIVITCHQVTVLCMRYLLEQLSENELLAINAQGEIANCSVTEYRYEPNNDPSVMALKRYNYVAPLARSGAEITAEKTQAAS